MDYPFISIVLPTYNVEKHIARCLDSCLAQNDNNFELVFVDDCGQDESIAIVRKYAASDDRVRLVSNPENQGTFMSRRAGAFAARGDYVFYVDPDDEIPADAIFNIRKSIGQRPADMIIARVRNIPSPKFYSRQSALPESCEFPHVIKKIFLDGPMVSWGTPGKIYSRQLLMRAYDKLSSVKERLVYGEDALLFYVCASLAGVVNIIHDYVYNYYINPGSITVATPSQSAYKADQLRRIIERLKDFSSDDEILSQHGAERGLQKIQALVGRDKIFIERHSGGWLAYLSSMLQCYVIDKDPRFLIRFFLSVLSLGMVRL